MTAIAKLVWGTRELDLTSNGYALFRDFVPPSTSYGLNVASGLAGSTSGGEVVGRTPLDRSWSWSVRIDGSTEAECRIGASRLQAFLNLAHDARHELQFIYRAENSPTFEPTWGEYGAYSRYRIKHAQTLLDLSYYLAGVITQALVVPISMTIGPHMELQRHIVAQAAGGIIDDTFGTADGASRGVIIPEGTTNKCVNPIFGASTYSTSWAVTDADLLYSLNTDKRYVLFGSRSVMLVNKDAAAQTFYVALTSGNTNTHTTEILVKKPDGSAITSADCTVVEAGTARTGVYTSIGDGFYRIHYTAAATNSSVAYGIQVAVGKTVYICGMQLEEKAYPTAMAYGGMPGVAWSSTAHASTSVRTAATWKLPTAGLLNSGEGSLMVAWRAPFANTLYPAGTLKYLFSFGTLSLCYVADDDKFYVHDGTNGVMSAAAAFAANALYELEITWGSGGFNLYVNGVGVLCDTFTRPAVNANFWLGSDTSGANQINGNFLACSTYTRALSAADVLAQATNALAALGGGDGLGQRIGACPYRWDIDGDGVLDAYSDATHKDWFIVSEVPGTAAARTVLDLDPGAGGGPIISNITHDSYVPPDYAATYPLFVDYQGTAHAGALGGEVNLESATSAGAVDLLDDGVSTVYPGLYKDWAEACAGKQVYLLVSIKDAGTTLKLQLRVFQGAYSTSINGPWQSVNPGAALNVYLIGPVTLPDSGAINYDWTGTDNYEFQLWGIRTTGTADVGIDFVRIMADDISAATTAGLYDYIVDGANITEYDATSILRTVTMSKEFSVKPGLINHVIICAQAHTGDAATLAADTVTIQRMYIYPCFELL